MADLPDDIARINALTTNARNTWFALLGVLVFVGITLMGVEHIDFYGVGRATTLPLVNVEVPTRYFFIAAPILTAAIYGYFHLYLIRLWDALGEAAPQHGTPPRPLGDVINPWLVTDAALHLRQRFRRDDCTTPRTMEFSAMLLNFLLAWGFGLVILTLIWWQSMAARSFLTTGTAGAMLVICVFTGAASLAMVVQRMKAPGTGTPINIWSTVPARLALLILPPMVGLVSHQRSEGATRYLAPLRMIDEDLVERPAGWLPYPVARAEFRAAWCTREKQEDCTDFKDREAGFAEEWNARRTAALSDMRRPDWHKTGREKPDLREARMAWAFLAGADLNGAQMEGANLYEAQMEGTTLRQAQLDGAVLFGAQMEGADVRKAQLNSADIRRARMNKVNLRWTNLTDADLRRAQMTEANMFGAQITGVNLRRTQMKKAYLHFSLLSGDNNRRDTLFATNLRAATNDGGAMRFLRLTKIRFDAETDFRNVFLDASVTYGVEFARQMGGNKPKPCQWVEQELNDRDFYALWRWWVEARPHEGYEVRWEAIAPGKWRGVPAADSMLRAKYGIPDDCAWQTGPMPE